MIISRERVKGKYLVLIGLICYSLMIRGRRRGKKGKNDGNRLEFNGELHFSSFRFEIKSIPMSFEIGGDFAAKKGSKGQKERLELANLNEEGPIQKY